MSIVNQFCVLNITVKSFFKLFREKKLTQFASPQVSINNAVQRQAAINSI